MSHSTDFRLHSPSLLVKHWRGLQALKSVIKAREASCTIDLRAIKKQIKIFIARTMGYE